VTVRPGAYVSAADPRLRDPVARHGLAVRAALARLGPGAVVSHVSAAVLHGLPVWAVPLRRVHVTRARASGGRRGGLVHVHVARFAEGEVVEVDELSVTSVARTIADLARSAGFESAVVAADAALRTAGATREELVEAVTRAAHRRGNPAAARVVAFADPRSESVGESRSRVALVRAGLPAAVPQWEVRSSSGALIGRVDFGWPGLGTVGEFDGRAKYGRLLRPGESAADAVVREKIREDAIRDCGLRVVRWTWDELARFDEVTGRLRRSWGGR
jgi:predicted transcriptional regulator of viral defense system